MSQPPTGYPSRADESLLKLDPVSIEDDDELALRVDGLAHQDPQARARQRDIVFLQGCLRDETDSGALTLMLDLEARMNERFSELALVLVRWAWSEGRRYPLPKSEETSALISEKAQPRTA